MRGKWNNGKRRKMETMKRDFNEFKEKIRGKRVGVVGIGVSNIPLIRFLVRLGAKVYAFDQREASALPPVVKEFEEEVTFFLGPDYLSHLHGLDVIFKTPGMRADHPALKTAQSEGAVITSEMEEFLRYCKGRTFGVTGSDGKTTTTTIIGALLKQEGYRVHVGGNIGMPLFDQVEDIRASDMVVLELSSFQLMTMETSPEVAVVTNLSPNHLDVHKDMAEYVSAKKNIFLHQSPEDLLVLNLDNDITRSFIPEAVGRVVSFSSTQVLEGAFYREGALFVREERITEMGRMKVKGIHNAENFLAAFLAVEEYVSRETMRQVAESFAGVTHRMEFLRVVDGVQYYNDSIASSPTRTLASIRSMGQKVNLILGGYDKNLDFEPLAKEGHPYIKAVVLVGKTRYKIERVFKALAEEQGIFIPVHMAESFEDAVMQLKSISRAGDIAMLSPACASFDMFRNFEERGEVFREYVNEF